MKKLIVILSLTLVCCSNNETSPVVADDVSRNDVRDSQPDVRTDTDSVTDLGTGSADFSADSGTTEFQPFGEVNREQFMRMANLPADQDGPFFMVNLIKFRQQAVYEDGRPTNLTGREANDLYSPSEFLAAIGARVVFVADVSMNLPLGDGTEWEQIAIVRYPTRAAFLGMIQDPAFQARSVHKDAGVEKTIVMVTEPIDLGLPDDFVPPPPPFPATEQDPEFQMIHVMSFHDVAMYEDGVEEEMRTGREAVQLYEANAGMVAAPLGVYPRAWFAVEGVLIGDGREWDEFRINHFPSGRTFQELTSDQEWASGRYHRDAGLADTYSMMSAPQLNTLDDL